MCDDAENLAGAGTDVRRCSDALGPRKNLHERAPHRHVPHIGVYLMSVHLMGVYLINMHLTGVHLMGMHLTGVHLMGVYLIGVYLMGVHLIDVYFMDVYILVPKFARAERH